MVDLAEIKDKNAAFAAEKHADQIAVFVGATSGIGEATLNTFTTLLVRPKIYVVGRSASRFEVQRERLSKLNSEAKIDFVEAEISQLKEVDRACQQILAKEERIDYLCMSSGYLPLAGLQETKEGLEQCFVLSYYARMRFLYNLLPLLRNSARPRVLSILNGGGEGAIREDDLGLKENWTIFNLVNHATTFNTLVLQLLAEKPENQEICFIHAAPGQVETWTERKPRFGDAKGFVAKGVFLGLRGLMWVLRGWVAVAKTAEESGERHAFLLTGEEFGRGFWRVGETCEEVGRSELVEGMKAMGLGERVWEFTEAVWRRVLREGA